MSLKLKTAFTLGTWFGSGKAPVASGTFGSLAALPFGAVIMYYGGWPALLAASIITYFVGVWAADIIMQQTKTQDPGLIVIDEVVGQWLALLSMPINLPAYLIAFLFFRFFDILKPWPVSWADTKLHNASGVMLDDVFAGIYAFICSHLLWFFIVSKGWFQIIEN